MSGGGGKIDEVAEVVGADVYDFRAGGRRLPDTQEILQYSVTGNPPVWSRDMGDVPPGLGGPWAVFTTEWPVGWQRFI